MCAAVALPHMERGILAIFVYLVRTASLRVFQGRAGGGGSFWLLLNVMPREVDDVTTLRPWIDGGAGPHLEVSPSGRSSVLERFKCWLDAEAKVVIEDKNC